MNRRGKLPTKKPMDFRNGGSIKSARLTKKKPQGKFKSEKLKLEVFLVPLDSNLNYFKDLQ